VHSVHASFEQKGHVTNFFLVVVEKQIPHSLSILFFLYEKQKPKSEKKYKKK